MPGHWEGDLIIGTDGTAIGTLVERSTRFTILLHLPGDHTAHTVAAAMIREMGKLPDHLRRSITWDRGSELADYDQIQTRARDAGLLLRPALALAARDQREHQPAPAALVREGHRPLRSTPRKTSAGRRDPQPPATAYPRTSRPQPTG